MHHLKKIRWQQRYANLTKAFLQLERGVAIDSPSEIEVQGIIRSILEKGRIIYSRQE